MRVILSSITKTGQIKSAGVSVFSRTISRKAGWARSLRGRYAGNEAWFCERAMMGPLLHKQFGFSSERLRCSRTEMQIQFQVNLDDPH